MNVSRMNECNRRSRQTILCARAAAGSCPRAEFLIIPKMHVQVMPMALYSTSSLFIRPVIELSDSHAATFWHREGEGHRIS